MIAPGDPHEPVTSEMWQALRDRYPNVERLKVAFALATDVETCESLLRGAAVDPGRLDPRALHHAREKRLVRLDLRAIDLLLEEQAA